MMDVISVVNQSLTPWKIPRSPYSDRFFGRDEKKDGKVRKIFRSSNWIDSESLANPSPSLLSLSKNREQHICSLLLAGSSQLEPSLFERKKKKREKHSNSTLQSILPSFRLPLHYHFQHRRKAKIARPISPRFCRLPRARITRSTKARALRGRETIWEERRREREKKNGEREGEEGEHWLFWRVESRATRKWMALQSSPGRGVRRRGWKASKGGVVHHCETIQRRRRRREKSVRTRQRESGASRKSRGRGRK